MKRSLRKFFSRPSRPGHLQTGRWGENVASRMLKRKGYRILGKRVRIGKKDELDLVVRDGDTLVFVEVKTRKDESFGRPAVAVTRDKRRHISRAAIRYVGRLRAPPQYIRFDIVEIVGKQGDQNPVVRHLENAFPLDKRYHLPF